MGHVNLLGVYYIVKELGKMSYKEETERKISRLKLDLASAEKELKFIDILDSKKKCPNSAVHNWEGTGTKTDYDSNRDHGTIIYYYICINFKCSANMSVKESV